MIDDRIDEWFNFQNPAEVERFEWERGHLTPIGNPRKRPPRVKR